MGVQKTVSFNTIVERLMEKHPGQTSGSYYSRLNELIEAGYFAEEKITILESGKDSGRVYRSVFEHQVDDVIALWELHFAKPQNGSAVAYNLLAQTFARIDGSPTMKAEFPKKLFEAIDEYLNKAEDDDE